MPEPGHDDDAATFPTETTGLPEAARPALLDLADGEVLELSIAPVAKRLREATVRMLAYNGSIPGPTLRVRQGSEVIVDVLNEGDLADTVQLGLPRTPDRGWVTRPDPLSHPSAHHCERALVMVEE